MGNIILKVVGILCIAVVSVVVLFTNRDDEDVVLKVLIFAIIALAIIFLPWERFPLFCIEN